MAILSWSASLRARPLSLRYHQEADDGGDGHTLEIEEHLPDGTSRTLLKRTRVPHGPAAAAHVTQRFAPLGGSTHWPSVLKEAFLQPESIVAGETLTLFGMPILIESALDERTNAWIESHGSRAPGAPPLPVGPPRAPALAAAAAYQAAGTTAAGAMYGGDVGAAMARREAAAALSAASSWNPEEDEVRRASKAWASARPALRDQPAVRGPKLRWPSEMERSDRAQEFGSRAVHWRARGQSARGGGHSSTGATAAASYFRLTCFLADDTVQVHALLGTGEGMQPCDAFSRSQGRDSIPGPYFDPWAVLRSQGRGLLESRSPPSLPHYGGRGGVVCGVLRVCSKDQGVGASLVLPGPKQPRARPSGQLPASAITRSYSFGGCVCRQACWVLGWVLGWRQAAAAVTTPSGYVTCAWGWSCAWVGRGCASSRASRLAVGCSPAWAAGWPSRRSERMRSLGQPQRGRGSRR